MRVGALARWRAGRLTAADGMDHFDLITFGERGLGVQATRDDIQVELHCDATPGQVQTGQQGRNGFTVGQFKGFAVQLNAHATGRHRF